MVIEAIVRVACLGPYLVVQWVNSDSVISSVHYH